MLNMAPYQVRIRTLNAAVAGATMTTLKPYRAGFGATIPNRADERPTGSDKRADCALA